MNSINLLMGKGKYFALLITGIFLNTFGFAQINRSLHGSEEDVKQEIQILKKYFYYGKDWHIAQPSVEKDVKGLINFIEDEPVDTILKNISNTFDSTGYYVIRLPENVPDSLNVPGYYPGESVKRDIEKIDRKLRKIYRKKKITVPANLITNLDKKLGLIPKEKGMQLFIDSVYTMPENLKIPEVIPDSVLNSPERYKELLTTDSLRNVYVEKKRVEYNDILIDKYITRVKDSIRQSRFELELRTKIKRLTDSVKVNNYIVLKEYNDKVVKAVNDSIYNALLLLSGYADLIDTTRFNIINYAGDTATIVLKKRDQYFSRIWLKNEQNDSLPILINNTGKRDMQMLIDDGVTFSHFNPKQSKEFDTNVLMHEINDFNNIGDSYKIEMPWRVGGMANVGLSQTYLQNWKKGGESSLSSLIVLKGFAYYTRADGKIKWMNLAEIRNGWIRPGGQGAELQKNDDKFEFTSRYSVSAYKKWYYSAEFNFETQFFKGFKYPKADYPEPISAFMSPAKSFLKLGFEYKPKDDFSLLLSPVTVKNVFVRDTALIDQTRFGVSPNRRSFWEPGLNADLRYKTKFSEDIMYETKYKMFINYKQPFRKFDINWENLLVFKLNDYFRVMFMLHLIYDDDVLFPVYDENNNVIGEKPRLQVKELMTIGFSYSLNKKFMKAKRIR